MGPIDYTLNNAANPLQSFLGGMQGGLQIQGMRQEQEQRQQLADAQALKFEAEQKKAQQESEILARQQQYMDTVEGMRTRGYDAEEMLLLAASMPKDMADSWRASAEALTKEQQRISLSEMTDVSAAMVSGNLDVARNIFTTKAAAYRNSPKPDEAKAQQMEAFLKGLEDDDPSDVIIGIGSIMSQFPGGPEAIRAIGEVQNQNDPDFQKVHGTTREDADGNVYALGTNGKWIKAPFQVKPEGPKISGGWILGPDGLPSQPVPMTPAQIAADSRAAESASRAERQLNVSIAGLEQNQAKTANEIKEKTTKTQQERDGKFKSINDLDSTLAAYRTALTGASRVDLVNPVSDKAVELQNLATQLQMAYKNAAELGAIAGPDWAIINRIIATPSGVKAAMLGPDKLLKQLDQVESLSKRQRTELNRIYGGNKAAPGWQSAGYASVKEAHADFLRARTAAYKAGKMDLVRKIDAEARADGVIK